MTPRPRRLPKEADLGRLRDLPRAEAIRIAMIKYGWDAATAAKRVDIERETSPDEILPRRFSG